jgi:hypothetical protein
MWAINSGESEPLSPEVLDHLVALSSVAALPPWTAWVEGRDQLGGDSFIQIGVGDARGDDMYVTRESVPASSVELDVIAAARNYLPLLVAEVRRLRALIDCPPN